MKQVTRLFQTVCFVGLVVLALSAFVSPADAGTKTQGSLLAQGSTDFSLGQNGKVAVKESPSDSGGLVMQLKLGKVSCPVTCPTCDPEKCTGSDSAPGARFHVLELNTDYNGVVTQVGLLYNLTNGKGTFLDKNLNDTGKNKISGGDVFGALAGVIQGQNLGIGFLRCRTSASTPGDCLTAPLLPGNGCLDGDVYALMGVTASAEAPAPPGCTVDADCAATQICVAPLCITDPCTQDSECRSFTGPGSDVACNETSSTCCFPDLDPDPDCDID